MKKLIVVNFVSDHSDPVFYEVDEKDHAAAMACIRNSYEAHRAWIDDENASLKDWIESAFRKANVQFAIRDYDSVDLGYMCNDAYKAPLASNTTAHWINPTRNPEYVNKEFFSDCSACGFTSSEELETCPHCWAKMEMQEGI